jgi:ankyrin repeat protein
MEPVLTFMLTKGANVNARSVNRLYLPHWQELPAGMTPLMLAVATNRKKHVEILLQHGADTSVYDANGKTVWDYAEEFADAALQALLKTAADPSAFPQ